MGTRNRTAGIVIVNIGVDVFDPGVEPLTSCILGVTSTGKTFRSVAASGLMATCVIVVPG
jgi:hypothetical protein